MTPQMTPTQPTNPQCLVCGLPLEDFDLSLNRQWHLDCEKCPLCGEGPMDLDMIQKALDEGKDLGHTGCLEAKAMRDLKDKTIPLRIEQLDILNREITQQWKVEPLVNDIDSLYKMLRALQETAANVSIVLGRTKEKIMVREAQDYRTKTKEQREAEKEVSRKKEQTKIETSERSAMLEAERKDPTLKLRRKALEGFLAIGLTQEQAEAMLGEKK